MADLYINELEQLRHQIQIDAALERVCNRTAAMQQSDELGEVLTLVFDELTGLGFDTGQYAIGIYDHKTRCCDWWMPSEMPGTGAVCFPIPYREEDRWHRAIYGAWENQESICFFEDSAQAHAESRGPWAKDGVLEKLPGRVRQSLLRQHTFKGWYVPTSHTILEVSDRETLPDEELSVLRRFGRGIDLACIRTDDLRQAEVRKQADLHLASLDRVRAEIASMHSSTDLKRITPLIWKELTYLGVPFFRCGVFIMDDESQYCHAYMTTPQGRALSVIHLPYQGNETTKRVVDYWHRGQIYTEFWDQKTLQEWMQSLVDRGQVSSSTEYLFDEAMPECIALHFLPFTQGMLYVGNHAFLSAKEIQLVQKLADTFATAYARYEDFGRMEQANQKIEAMLVELEGSRAQLLQAEKMASLGELAAGIAHEIQNPLNFVNNFSEISIEMIEELKEALHEEDSGEADAIMLDLTDNIGKINYHSKRAVSIVRGMLQHSRRSTGEKTPTDLNALADEYLRLAYHGLRAKDNTFNADFRTEPDPNLPQVSVAASDVGRVFLNLINNAFYAVSEKRKKQPEGYKPMVTVGIRKLDDSVEVHIRDNGTGIPDEVRDKIFQPFFTTKPNGQGTGLGLSLSNDIVKAHGGELRVESRAGEGTEFVVRLPIE